MIRRSNTKKSLLLAGLILIALAIAAEVLLLSLRYENLWAPYNNIIQKLYELEDIIMGLNKKWQFFGAIMGLYLIKSFFPIYFTSTVCFITGAVFPYYISIPVNLAGFALQLTIKYFWGSKFGAPQAWKLIRKNDVLRHAVQSGGKGNPITLFALRIIPGMPVNTISSIYGSLHFGFLNFFAVSVLGYLPRLISFTFVGHNIYDPLSAKFLVPVMIIAFLSGISLLGVNGVWTLVDRFVSHYNEKNKADVNILPQQKESDNDD